MVMAVKFTVRLRLKITSRKRVIFGDYEGGTHDEPLFFHAIKLHNARFISENVLSLRVVSI